MAMTIAEEAEWFSRALNTARPYGVTESGRIQTAGITAKQLADRLYPSIPPNSRITRADVYSVARRAITAYERGVQLSRQPDHPPGVRDIPENYGIRSNQSRYEYRVAVVRTQSGVRDWTTVVIVRSGRRLDAETVELRAMRAFTPQQGLQRNYDSRLNQFGEDATVTPYIFSVSQRTPN